MKITNTPLEGLLIIEPTIYSDTRGYFFEIFQEKRYQHQGIPSFVQDNTSRSKKNVLRGLHYQLPHSQGKLVWVTKGAAWDVAVDLRLSSKTFGQWFGLELNETNHKQFYIPAGFAHGFCVLEDDTDFHYKCTNFYTPTAEKGIAWNDERLNIAWPINSPILSSKDEAYPNLNEIPHEQLFA